MAREKVRGVYCIENLMNSKKYIGQSCDIYGRWSHHRWELNKGKHSNKHLQNAWNQYSESNFSFFILERCSVDNIDSSEQYYIKLYRSNDGDFGYNLDSGGNLHKTHSVETISKMRASAIGIFPSEETKQKISQNRKGKMVGADHFMYGKHLPLSTKIKLSKSITGMFSGDKHYSAKKVICTTTGEIFNTIKDAALKYSVHDVNISKCCKGQRKSAGKTDAGAPLQWEYYENDKLYDAPLYICETNAKSICQYTIDGDFVAKYNSARDASASTGIGYRMISRVCNNSRPHTHGYLFKFTG